MTELYTLNNHNGPSEVRVFTQQGSARDALREKNLYMDDMSYYIDSNPVVLSDESVLKSGLILYRKYEFDFEKNSDTGRYTAWHLDNESAEAEAERMGLQPTVIYEHAYKFPTQIGRLDTSIIEPLPKELFVTFQPGKKGPMCRINSHPERDGFVHINKAKIFFPDKTFQHPDIGPAYVSVSKELETFGFLTGHMIRFDDTECPTVEEILDWAKEKHIQGDLIEIQHPSRGTYYAIGAYTRPTQLSPNESYSVQQLRATMLTQGDDTHTKRNIYISHAYPDIVEHDYQECPSKTVSLNQAIIERAWGPGACLEDVDNAFVDSKYFRLINDWDKSVKYYGPDIEKAVKLGVIKSYKNPKHHIEIMTMDRSLSALLLDFSLETAKAMAADFTRINNAADEALKNLKRKGKI